jgi:bacterioferritin-associated ferredoxin
MSSIYSSLGRAAKCGRCTHTIKSILEDIRQRATVDRNAIAA